MTPRLAGRFAAWFLVPALFAAACGPGTDDASAIDVVTDRATPTPVATTPPLEVPTSVPTLPAEPVVAIAPAVLPTATPAATAAPATVLEAPAPAAAAAPADVSDTPSEPTAPPTAAPAPAPAPSATAEPLPAPTATPQPAPTAAPVPTAEPTVSGSASSAAPTGPRVVTQAGHVTLGQAGSVSLVLPVVNVELVGFHQAGHPGSQAINAAASGVPSVTLDSRSRGTGATSAADIVVPPGEAIRSPVTGTVIASNAYTLYCEHVDKLVYIEPDGLPGWQVRVFHIVGTTPPVGTRVIAGETLIADGPRQLPFESQVDELTAEPSWPHVHVEVVDTNVPDTRPPGPGCG